MRIPRTLSRYILREVVQYTLIGLAAISVVFVTRNLFRMLDRLIGAGLLWTDFALVLRLLATLVAPYTLPVAFLFGVLLALGRMAGDAEIIAMRACGVGRRQVAAPVLLLAGAISLFAWELALDVEPRARQEMNRAAASMLMRGAIIEPGRFFYIRDRLLYVDERDEDGVLHGVILSDGSNLDRPILIFAETAEISLDEGRGSLTLHLRNGGVHVDAVAEPDALYQRIAFASFDYEIDVAGALTPRADPRAKDMTTAELRAVIARLDAGDTRHLREDNPIVYRLHLQRRFATPLAAVMFALVGVPLALRRQRGARSFGALLCAVVAFGYYLLLSFSEFTARQGWLPAVPAVWLPNLAFGALAVWLLRRTVFERS